MSEIAISIASLGKAYKMYQKPSDKVLDAFGLTRWMPWRRSPYREFWALRDLNLQIRRGERIGFVGRNGAGKSTLLKIIAGTIAPTEGAVTINGKVHALMELGTGFHPEFTGRENIRAALAYHGLDDAEISERVGEIIDFSELEDFIDQPVKTYSAGMYARLAFSASTSIRPEILIIDEVLGAGDAYFAGKCMDRMKKLTERDGVTVLFVSHDISSVQQLCTRAIWIDRGSVVEDGNTVDVAKAYYRSIQQEEALRRKAQARGVRKIRNLQLMEDVIEKRVLFHFVAPGGAPVGRHKVRKVELRKGQFVVASLIIGGPMDNQVDAGNKVLDDPGYMDWSPAKRDSSGPYRLFENQGGSYQHAPFELTVVSAEFPSSAYSIAVDGEFDPVEEVRLELYWDNSYHLVGRILGGVGPFCFSISDVRPHADVAIADIVISDVAASGVEPLKIEAVSETEPPLELPATPAAEKSQYEAVAEALPLDSESGRAHTRQAGMDENSIVTWERPDPRIEGVRFLDATGIEAVGVEELTDLVIEISYYSSKKVVQPVFSMSIFQANGTLLCHANSALARVSIDYIEGYGSVQFRFPQFAATEGDYVMGCSIFHYLDPAHYFGQPPYYDQHDRAYRFKIWKRLDNNMSLGCVRLPFEVKHIPAACSSSAIADK